MGLQTVLDIGKNALAYNQVALQTISHNIANSGVEGYSRQEVVAVDNTPNTASFGYIGTGVRIETVRQYVDSFLNSQITRVKSDLAALTARSDALQLTETFLNIGSADSSLSGAYNDFFTAAEDLATKPEGTAERTAFVNAAENLASEFNTTTRSVEELQIQANRDISSAVDEANTLAERIADLNSRIEISETAGRTANDLRDERQRDLENLGQLVSIDYLENDDGSVTVMVGKGFPLVQSGEYNSLKMVEDPDNVVGASPPVALGRINFVDSGGITTDITSRISSGKIGGLLTFRDTSLQQFLDDMNSLAATTVNQLNLIHQQGYGLDGSTNLNLFNPLSISVDSISTNSKDESTKKPNVQAVVSSSGIFDASALTVSNYRIEFTSTATPTSGATFKIVDQDTGLVLDETKVSINGAAFGTDETKTEFGDPSSPPPTSLTLEFEGLRVTLQNFGGLPQKGDAFNVSVRKASARNMTVNSVIANDISKVAAAGAPGIPGDNDTALAIANLRGELVAKRGTTTLPEFFDSIVSRFATETRNVRSQEDVASQFADSLNESRESVSGVSLDEELTNIIRYQQNFGAMSRLMSIASDLLKDVLQII